VRDGLGFLPHVIAERPPDVVDLVEPAGVVAADVALVSGMGLDQLLLSGWHRISSDRQQAIEERPIAAQRDAKILVFWLLQGTLIPVPAVRTNVVLACQPHDSHTCTSREPGTLGPMAAERSRRRQ